MSCCNQAPNGGSNDPKLLFKVISVFAVIVLLLVLLFG